MEKKIKDPENYIYRDLKNFQKLIFSKVKKEFSILLTNNQKMKN